MFLEAILKRGGSEHDNHDEDEFEAADLDENKSKAGDWMWRGTDKDGNFTSYLPKLQPGRRSYRVVIMQGEPWTFEQWMGSVETPAILAAANSGKKRRRGGGESKNVLGSVSPGGVSKNKYKKEVTTGERQKVYPALRRFGIECKDWMSFDDILEVCKINKGVSAHMG